MSGHMAGLVADLRATVARVQEGGGPAARAKHMARGKMLPRDRVEALLDPGAPVPGDRPARGPRDVWRRGAGGRDRGGRGPRHGPRMHGGGQRRHRERGTYFPLTVKKHLRAQEIAQANRLPASTSSIQGAPTSPIRTRSSRIATISAASSSTRPRCRGRHPPGGGRHGILHGRGGLRAGHGGRERHRAEPGHDLPRRAAPGEGRDRRGRHGRGPRRRRPPRPRLGRGRPLGRDRRPCARHRAPHRRHVQPPEARVARPRPATRAAPRSRGPRRGRAARRPRALRRPRDHRPPRRRLRLRRVQAPLRPDLGHGLRADLGLPGRHRGQQRDLFGESARKARISSSSAPARRASGVPCRTSRASWWGADTRPAASQGRRQDGDGGRDRGRAQVHRDRRRLLRGRQLRHVRPRLLAPLPLDVAQRPHLGDGGHPAASVLAQVRRDGHAARGGTWPVEEEEAFKAPSRRNTRRKATPTMLRRASGTTASSRPRTPAPCWRWRSRPR